MDDEITKLNTVSMAGHGAETASGYAQIGGSREYREAMRKAKSAEKRGDWDEYEKQMQIAEDSEISRMNYAQSMVAKYGDARDEMLETIKNTIYSKKLSQEDAIALDKKYMELMPYGWYNSFEPKQFNQLKKQLVDNPLLVKHVDQVAFDALRQYNGAINDEVRKTYGLKDLKKTLCQTHEI